MSRIDGTGVERALIGGMTMMVIPSALLSKSFMAAFLVALGWALCISLFSQNSCMKSLWKNKKEFRVCFYINASASGGVIFFSDFLNGALYIFMGLVYLIFMWIFVELLFPAMKELCE